MADDSSLEQFERLRPDRVRSPEEAVEFLNRFLEDIVRQPTHESASLSLETHRGDRLVRGWVSYPASLDAFERLWSEVPFGPVPFKIEVLPDSSTSNPLGTGGLFAAAARKVVGHAGPSAETPVVHIWNRGDPIQPVLKTGDHFLCRSGTGYLGWVSCDEPDLTDPDSVLAEPAPRNPRLVDRVSEIALPWLGTPYVWGGTGEDGIDCSGFTQRVYRELGWGLPRDAHQQMLGGEIVSSHESRYPPDSGDLLFFTLGDGRIGHVALSLGGWRIIHAERPGVTVCSLEEGNPEYNRERDRHFVLAKRYFL